jgi:hypothetical protein
MANHYLLVGVASRDWERAQAQPAAHERDGDDDVNFVGEFLDQEITAMETAVGEFGCYECRIDEPLGDCSPRLIQIECSWKPPEPEVLAKLTGWLCAKFFLKAIAWVGHDPKDLTVKHLEVSP